ncbi:hypothetical protein P154DRAFT_583323 [Amniculicola lignicola CBS 123094]|uniref:Uncharacterized protein n=1 Tax=Amniculicola lignicola CBS 123094 TaxID=1392246 RepID=A0A6A5VSX8_9PLEO|nr:hypothetical protein P154DRAFT_583323 [Amniculicola lignicola CBS 123094]
MPPRITKENQDNNDSNEINQQSQRQTRTKTAMATPAELPDDNVSDDGESYEPSNEENPEPEPQHEDEDQRTEKIDATDYVGTSHPLRPKRASQILSDAKQLTRFQNHPDYWWDILLAMDKRAKMNKGNSSTNETL